jgi:general nucleoside transport system permease protein
MQIERRESVSRWAWALAPAAAIAFTLLVSSLLVAWAGAPVGQTLVLLFEGAFGSVFALSETLTRATPLIFTGLAAAVAFRAKLFNIGGEGQLYMGALAAVVVAGLHGGTGFDAPPFVLFIGMVIAGACAGALFLLGPAWLKARYSVDEVVTTLLLNFIIMLFVSMMLNGAMKDPTAMGWPQSVALNSDVEMSKLIAKTRVHTGLLWALGLAVVIALINRYTALGFEMRAVGANAQASHFLGLSVNSVMLKTACISGGLAGLAGVFEVAGRTSYVTLDMSPGYGYTGIVIAMLAGLSPIGVVVCAVFVAGMIVGADSMSRVVSVPNFIADVIVAVALIAMLVAAKLTQYRLKFGVKFGVKSARKPA